LKQHNVDVKTVDGFGVEWSRFDQSALSSDEHRALFDQYFRIFDFAALSANAEGFDAGCGSGRWARGVAPRVGVLHCVDASDRALQVARSLLKDCSNCRFHHASLDALPFEDGSMDFGYSLGVLHHLPDPAAGLMACTAKLKPGAPFLVYMYYAFDDKPTWYVHVWRVADVCRRVISRLPPRLRVLLADIVAVSVYWPLARVARMADRAGYDVSSFPLAFYRRRSFYTMRTDALDRLGTRVEHRFTQAQIHRMMTNAGLSAIRFSESTPYWCAIGTRA
jgi:SAM-dependent methyltransferase